MKKIQCHDSRSVIIPPSTGPSTLVTANTMAIEPWRRARSFGGTRSPMMICASGMKPPEPMPWMARNAISCVMLCAKPHSTEPSRKVASAVKIIGRRPYWSASLPYSGIVAVDASTYAVTTHDKWFMPPRSPTMRGRAVATMLWSSAPRPSTAIRAR